MPLTREEHQKATRDELTSYPYYLNIISYLNKEKIEHYIDIGANVGEFCNVLFEKIPSLKTAYLIEPEIDNFNYLKENINNKNISTFNCAIGYNLDDPILVQDIYQNVGGFFIIDRNKHSNYPTFNSSFKPVVVNIKTLEDLNLPIVDLVKIDVEGGEYNIIENSIFLFKNKYIGIEFHNINFETINNYINKNCPTHEIIFSLVNRRLLKIKNII